MAHVFLSPNSLALEISSIYYTSSYLLSKSHDFSPSVVAFGFKHSIRTRSLLVYALGLDLDLFIASHSFVLLLSVNSRQAACHRNARMNYVDLV